MHPIISIVGKSQSGKTTLLEALIIELKQRGYRLAVIKHTHENFEIDKVGKDSWRFSQAGSEVVAICSSHKLAIMKQLEGDLNPRELSRFIDWDYDLLLTEGFKTSDTFKIEVHLKEQGEGLLTQPKQLLAVVTDEPLDIDIPQLPRDEIRGTADLIENWLRTQLKENDIELFINHAFIPIKPFVKDIMAKTLLGMVSSLKGVKEIKSLHISLRRKS